MKRRTGWPLGIVIVTVLIVLVTERRTLERMFPALHGPAPAWMGLAMLAIPVVVGIVYVGLLIRRRRRQDYWSTGAGRKDDSDADCGGGGSGCGGSSHSGCGGGDGGCGGGCGGGGH